MAAWLPMLPFLFLAALIAVEDMLSIPSCTVSGGAGAGATQPDDLKVMLVADLLLRGSDAGYADLLFRNPYTARFFKKSFEKLDPDMLIVLGDISARGSELTEHKWLPILQQFQAILGPFASLPYHVTFGDRDIGECSKLDRKFVREIASNLPGLDSYGCGSFRISNISFVSLNAVAMLCGNNDLRFGVEKVIERESVDLRSLTEDSSKESVETEEESNFRWRANNAALGSGPVLLLHFPLHRAERNSFGGDDILKGNVRPNPPEGVKWPAERVERHMLLVIPECSHSSNSQSTSPLSTNNDLKLTSSNTLKNDVEACSYERALKGFSSISEYSIGNEGKRSKSTNGSGVIGTRSYQWIHTLPPNATEYIFQSLKPRMVFSAHTHFFCDRIHIDGTREVTVPAMTWATSGDPGFVLVTFKQNDVVIVSHCSLARESRVLLTYIIMFILLIVTTLLVRWSYLINFTSC